MKKLLAILTAIALCTYAEARLSSGTAATSMGKPNFSIIFTDDQGYNDLGCFGSKTLRTPHIDRLAAEGRKFTSFLVPSPVCTASRAGLLTGSYPKRVGLHKGVLFPTSDYGLNAAEYSIADHFKSLGYAAACIGKWHLGHHPETLPRAHGFDSYYGIPYSNDMNHPDNRNKVNPATDESWLNQDKWVQKWKTPLMENEKIIELPVDQRTITRRYTDRAISFITENKDKPFFLYLPHSMPHIPLFVPQDAYDPYPENAYKATIEHIDTEVGRLADSLRELGLAENTYLIYLSDNGPWLPYANHGGSAAPLRDGKGSTFEGGVRVPAVIWAPGRIPAGTSSDALISSLDLMPSFAALAGSEIPAEHRIDGLDLSSTLTGDEPSRREEFLYYTVGGEIDGIRQGGWKLLLKGDSIWGKKRNQPETMLFRITEDISESNNLAKEHPEKVAALIARMKEMDVTIEAEARTVWKEP